MSADYFFKKWRSILPNLEILVNTDLEHQEARTHDKKLPEAVHRLTTILAQYMVFYNKAMECLQNNLQVQKTQYMRSIVNAIVDRILELKHQLEKLEGSPFQFLNSGLIANHKTPFNAEMTNSPSTIKRLRIVQDAIDTGFERVKEKRDAAAALEVEEEAEAIDEREQRLLKIKRLFEPEDDESSTYEVPETKEEKTEEEIKITALLNLIISHEKTRQVIKAVRHKKHKREVWRKELEGTAQPPARYELRERAAKMLQTVFRTYFEIKRKRIVDCQLKRLLGMDFCDHPNLEKHIAIKNILTNPSEQHDTYEKEMISEKEKFKKHFSKWMGEAIAEDYRDVVRGWFHKWFEDIRFIHNIPLGGCADIFKEEMPEPSDWLEECQEAEQQKKANKGKTPLQLKFEQLQAKREDQFAKRLEKQKQIAEQALRRKMMKDPNLHPGFDYPQSKKIDQLVKVLKEYHQVWDKYDAQDTAEVKRKFVKEINKEDAFMEVKCEALLEVDQDMQIEYKKLKKTLIKDYASNGETMIVPINKLKKKKKKPIKLKAIPSERISVRVENLVEQGFIIEYPKTRLEDLLGDPNFAGEDLRRIVKPALPQSFEVRAWWWNQCLTAYHGGRRILLVGPDGSGKNKLVHILASLNDAILFEVDPLKICRDLLSPAYLKLIASNIITCAKSVQPSVIYIRNVQKLYYRKTPPAEADFELNLIKRALVQKLLRRIDKKDKITIIGSCSDPWLTKSKKMLRNFPTIILMPNNSHPLTAQILKNWVLKYPSIPAHFNISCLAQVLQRYSYGNLEELLDKFMSPERLVKIAAHRLTPMELYNFVLEEKSAVKIEYDRYLKWYWDKTTPGKIEKHHIEQLKEFQSAVVENERRKAKKQKMEQRSAASSAVTSLTEL